MPAAAVLSMISTNLQFYFKLMYLQFWNQQTELLYYLEIEEA
jgi:hypothetical protein